MPTTSLALGPSALLTHFLAWALLGYIASRCSPSPQLDVVGTYSPQWVGLWLISLARNGQTRLQCWWSSLFEDPKQADLYLTEFPSESVPPICFCGWTKLLVWMTTWAPQVDTRSAQSCVLIAPSPSPLLLQSQILSTLQSPWGAIKAVFSVYLYKHPFVLLL